MACVTRSVKVYTCDDNTCDVTHYREKRNGDPDGFHGRVSEVDGKIGATTNWYACSSEHISGAILAALVRASEGEQNTGNDDDESTERPFRQSSEDRSAHTFAIVDNS